MSQVKKNPSTFVAFCAVLIYMLHSITGGINPAMATLMAQYPEASVATVTLISSIVMVGAIPGNLICGSVVAKAGFKPTLYGALILSYIGGLLPFFIENIAIGALIVCRLLVGIGYGFFLAIGPSYITATFEGDRKTKILGYASSVAGLAGMLTTLLGGYLLGFGLKYVYLYHLAILVPPTIFALFLPKMKVASEEGEKAVSGWKLNRQSVFFAVIQGVTMFFLYPILVYVSNIVAQYNIGTTQQAANIMTVFSVASMLCGFVYSFSLKIGKKRLMGICFAMIAIAMAIMAFTKSIALYYIGNFIAGFGYSTFIITCMNSIGICSKPNQVTNVCGLGFAIASLAPTLCAYFFAFVIDLFGQTGNFSFYFVVSFVCMVVLAVIFLIKPVVPVSYEENLARKEAKSNG